MAFMAASISATAMDMADRPKLGRNNQEVTTQKPEVTTEDTANRILSLPVEDKCANRKLPTKISTNFPRSSVGISRFKTFHFDVNS